MSAKVTLKSLRTIVGWINYEEAAESGANPNPVIDYYLSHVTELT